LRRRSIAEDAIDKLVEWGVAEADGGNAFYLFWHPAADWNWVECIAPDELTPSLQGIGANCTKLYNWLLRWLKAEGLADVDAVGGTGDYYNALVNANAFSLDAGPFAIGTFLVRQYYDDNDQGHAAMVMTEPDENGNQILLQSDHDAGQTADWSIGWPGVNYSRTIADTHDWAWFERYGELPGLGVVG
jgi:hypothetical protein